jgi:hypothetical protein
MKNGKADLSVIVVIGDCRERAERMLGAVASQSGAEQIELIVVDAASHGAPDLSLPAGLRVKYVRAEAGVMPGSARGDAIKFATAPVIAFLEEHCFPEEGWASAVIEAHRGDSAAVGYTFLNGSPDTYLYRSFFMAEYGPWGHPQAGGAASQLPGSNVSYKNEALVQFGERLTELFEMEYLLQEGLRQRGAKFCTEPKAVVSHECFVSFWELLCSHFLLGRIQAARRAQVFSWGLKRRLVVSLAAPLVLPWLQLYRAWKVLRGHRLFSAWVYSIPITYLTRQFEAIGESIGLLAGAEDSIRSFAPRELNGARAGKTFKR